MPSPPAAAQRAPRPLRQARGARLRRQPRISSPLAHRNGRGVGGEGTQGGADMAMKVYLLDNGTLLLDKSLATWNHNQGVEFRFPVYAIFIDHPDAKIMLDTGFDRAWV